MLTQQKTELSEGVCVHTNVILAPGACGTQGSNPVDLGDPLDPVENSGKLVCIAIHCT